MTKKEEILRELSEMKGRLNGLSLSDKSLIESSYVTVFRRPFTRTGCGDCYKDAVIQMYAYLQKNEIMEKKSNYMLKAGVIIMLPGNMNIYNNFNLTDDAAEKFLRENPKAIVQFQAYPEDWEKRIAGDTDVKTTDRRSKADPLKSGKKTKKNEPIQAPDSDKK